MSQVETQTKKTGDWLIDGHFVFLSPPVFFTSGVSFLTCHVAGLTSGSRSLSSVLAFGRSLWKHQLPPWVGEKERKRKSEAVKKINRFPLSGWAVSLACQWSRHTPGALDRHWQEESMLTVRRNKSEHRFALQERKGPSYTEGPCSGGTEEHGVRRQWALDQGFFRVGARMWSGFHTLPPYSAVWLSYFSPLTLLSLHQLFTFGSTKGNPGALIVAERNSSPSQSATSSFFLPLSPSLFPPWLPISCPQPILKKLW